MTVEFDTPAARVIEQFSGKDDEQFRIPVNLPDITFLRALSVQGRLRFSTSSSTDTSNIFTPAEGETIFIYRLRVQHLGAGEGTFSFINAGQTRDIAEIDSTFQPLEINILDSLVGNASNTIGLTISNSGGASRTSILGWSENTSRIRDVTI